MKLSSLWRMLIFIIIIIIIISGTIILITVRGPVTDPSPCLFCGLNGLKYLGIAEVISGIVSLGLISKIRNNQIF